VGSVRIVGSSHAAARSGAIALAFTACAFAVSGASGASQTGGEPRGTPTAHHFGGTRAVGALFPPGGRVHTCTASVVHSHARNLLITAAHCITGTGDGYVFVPGYRNGIAPLGSWTVISAYATPQWMTGHDEQADIAFLVVAPQRIGGRLRQIEDITGAYTLAKAPVAGIRVTVPAYALGSDDQPVTCTARVYYTDGFPAFNCNPYPSGTSGAPWLARQGHTWAVVGAIGGLHQGGCLSWTSYSAAFGAGTLRAAAAAEKGRHASPFPPIGSSGC